MYDKVKELVQTKPLYFVGIGIVLFGVLAFILVSPSGRADSDYNRAIGTVERAQEQQRKSIDLNQGVQNAVDRSIDLNRQSSERINRIEEYQRATIQRVDESKKRLDDAEDLLERNQRIFDAVESRPQTQQGDRKTP
nr:MAG TPA: protein of unknown function (DUF883) [Caudoviricetes sp.]